MAEVNAKDLTTKTAPASTDSMLLFGTTTNEGAKITVDNLADNILERLATKTFPNQVGGSSAATILAQLATLNSNFLPYYREIENGGVLTITDALPHSYYLAVWGSNDGSYCAYVGAGYGANNGATIRHKLVKIIGDTSVVVTPFNTQDGDSIYGLRISNGTGAKIYISVTDYTRH